VANLGKEEMSKVNGGHTDFLSCYMDISCAHYTWCGEQSCPC
jgi:hypothetical protein